MYFKFSEGGALEKISNAKDTPPLLGLFDGFEGGESLALQIFLRASPSKNLRIHPKIGACGGLLCNLPYKVLSQLVKVRKTDKLIRGYNEIHYYFSQRYQVNPSDECNKTCIFRIFQNPELEGGGGILSDIVGLIPLNLQ